MVIATNFEKSKLRILQQQQQQQQRRRRQQQAQSGV
jgi:hypothetical protein